MRCYALFRTDAELLLLHNSSIESNYAKTRQILRCNDMDARFLPVVDHNVLEIPK